MKNQRKMLILSSLGGALEAYDFLIFVFFVSYISQLFFAPLSPFWRDVSAYGLFSAGYILRPFGGVILAHFGDRFGRKNIFILSLILMVIPIFVIAMLPTYAQIGALAPAIMLAMRMLQGISFGGEVPGAFVFVYEHASRGEKGLFLGVITGCMSSGVMLGILVTLAINFFFTADEILNFIWRVPFFLGAIFGIFAIFLRRYMSETPEFLAMKRVQKTEPFPLKAVLASPKIPLLIAALMSFVLSGVILMLSLLLPNFFPQILNITKISANFLQLFGIVALVFGCITTGILIDRRGIMPINLIFCGAFLVLSFAFFNFLYAKTTALAMIFYVATNFFAGFITFTPLLMCKIFPAAFALTAISLIYNVIYAFSGVFFPQIFVFLHHAAMKNHEFLGSGGFLCAVFIAFCNFVALFLFRRAKIS